MFNRDWLDKNSDFLDDLSCYMNLVLKWKFILIFPLEYDGLEIQKSGKFKLYKLFSNEIFGTLNDGTKKKG